MGIVDDDAAAASPREERAGQPPETAPGQLPKAGTLTLAEAQRLWDVDPGYLDTTSYGPPPRRAWDDLQDSLDAWRRGTTPWRTWIATVERSRELFAALVHARPGEVATGAAVSQLLAPVAQALPDGAQVLVPDIEFTSGIFPFAVHADRGVEVRTAPLSRLAEAITADTDLISVSAAQSSTGEVADLAAITRRAREVGAIVIVDATQAAGWLPLDASGADVLVAAAYKWLCAPRGTAFLAVHPELRARHEEYAARLKPLAAGWFAGEGDAVYGMPLRLAEDARAFDISPAWHSWVGTAPALETLLAVGVETIHEHDVGLANAFRTGIGMVESDSAIVAVDLPDDALARLRAAGVRFSIVASRARFAFHLYTTEADVATAVEAVRG
ncbi:aminotransferase class V-fold PLP-dependent enzyme [Brevibacterium casei]|uniref:Selenocysteine lyase/Cysteine desulfurase n=2 Tax=Brevibacterium casei TaxID=33889 RepID=A0A2H1HW49_9MICO|nr:aminotransferase class V-fold PLP-dependent enzyme [Brevibacterium casei]MCT1550832.1 aminotransferase class V-fold PLP-dependent enzyme [Brevibacterium casei]MCT1559091.1 aminotransferase class V-fold PLP-dependent enzyme [Brevibacterium casei]MCT2206948.1 aminotransferase class V-fold PLP-dependent enzyme [Brevibacterium casei]QPR38238.1 aminotransferase class V-fold PLP-dependent enzyme [Brevibacterium casei]QPR42403.1 aminotransferase class V-fold PLP-dependent enzyme [Brevibacterium ca